MPSTATSSRRCDHAQAADSWPYAARLLGEHALSLILDGRWATVGALLATFPRHAASDPELAPVFVSEHLRNGSLEDAAASLALGEQGVCGVPADRRRGIEVRLAVMRLWLAGLRGDFSSVVDQVESRFASVEADTPGEVGLGDDVRAAALLSLGIAEIWSQRMADAEIHLLQAMQLARRARRPYLETQCLARLAGPLQQRSLAVARERALEAIALADKHGWGSESFVTFALIAAATVDVWQGQFEDAEALLARAERVPPHPVFAVDPQFVRGMLHDAEGRYEQALAAFREGPSDPTRYWSPSGRPGSI
jgi:LuxR family maltose regulon positive regulatory protein